MSDESQEVKEPSSLKDKYLILIQNIYSDTDRFLYVAAYAFLFLTLILRMSESKIGDVPWWISLSIFSVVSAFTVIKDFISPAKFLMSKWDGALGKFVYVVLTLVFGVLASSMAAHLTHSFTGADPSEFTYFLAIAASVYLFLILLAASIFVMLLYLSFLYLVLLLGGIWFAIVVV